MSESFVNPIFGEQAPRSADEPAEVVTDRLTEVDAPEVDAPEPGATGNPRVDAVVESLSTLDQLPVAEHVAVFEQAHESLRRTLAGAGTDGTPHSPAVARS
jgi:hypothetical protein